MTKQLDELRHWISSLESRERLFENRPNEPAPPALDPLEGEDLQA